MGSHEVRFGITRKSKLTPRQQATLRARARAVARGAGGDGATTDVREEGRGIAGVCYTLFVDLPLVTPLRIIGWVTTAIVDLLREPTRPKKTRRRRR